MQRLVLCLLLLAAWAPRSHAGSSEGIAWQPDLTTAFQEARRSGRDLLLDFVTDWCVWCKVQDSATYSVPEFVEYSKRYLWVKVDAERDTLAARKYGIRAYPTVVVVRPDGLEYDRVVGYTRPADFQAQVEDYRAGRNTLAALLDGEEAHRADCDYEYRLADRLYAHGRSDDALQRYQHIFESDTANASGHAEECGYMVARTLRRAGDFGRALPVYQVLVRRFPEGQLRAGELFGLGLSLEAAGQTPEAAAAFEEFVREFPNDASAPEARQKISALRGAGPSR